MKFKQFVWGLAVAAGVGVASAPVSAATVTTSTWYTFGFGDIGSALVGVAVSGTNPESIAAPEGPWTIMLGSTATLTVVDLELSGDRFELFDGLSIGFTSDPVAGEALDNPYNIGAALANPNFSKGSFLLSAGEHSLTGKVGPNSLGNGIGAFIIEINAVNGVPEPGSFALAGLALLGLSLAGRKTA